jgi:glycosyltransferase involved in cell wall biosynthesis
VTPSDERTLVVIPTYEERDTLPAVLAGLRALPVPVDVLVVDDASPDGTGQLAERLAATDPHRHVLHRTAKAGLGSAYRTGFRWGMERGYGRFVAMDGDLSHDPAAVPELLEASQAADVVIGSRYVPGGRVERWPLHRRLLSAGGNLYARGLTGSPVHDGTSGFRVVHRAVLEAIGVQELRSEGYAFQLEVAWRAWRCGFLVTEVPIVFVERRAGASKLSRAVVAEALWRTASWAAREGRRPPDIHPASVRADAAGATRPGR